MHNIKLPLPFSDVRELLIENDKKAIELAAMHLGDLWEIFGDANLVIVAYNKGEMFMFRTLKKGEQLPVEYLDKVRKAIEQEIKKDVKSSSNKKF